MKVSGPSSSAPSGASKGARPAASGTFSLGGASPAAPVARTVGAGPVASLEALIALQEVGGVEQVGGPLERKRRAMGRASRILDVLDEVKVSLLSGELSADSLDRLGRAIRDQRDATDEPGLEAVLDEIETRAAVEMAKLEVAKVAA